MILPAVKPAIRPPARIRPEDAAPAAQKSPAASDLPELPSRLVGKCSLTVSYSLLVKMSRCFVAAGPRIPAAQQWQVGANRVPHTTVFRVGILAKNKRFCASRRFESDLAGTPGKPDDSAGKCPGTAEIRRAGKDPARRGSITPAQRQAIGTTLTSGKLPAPDGWTLHPVSHFSFEPFQTPFRVNHSA